MTSDRPSRWLKSLPFASTIRSPASSKGSTFAQRPAVVREPRLLVSQRRRWRRSWDSTSTSLDADARAAIFAGNTLPEGAEPLAQAYAGHQFGGFSPQLGDGRALLLGEVIDRQGTPSRHRIQGLGPHAVRPRRRRQGRRWSHAARGAGQRGDARARHPHHARARRGGDRRAGLSRTARCPARC